VLLHLSVKDTQLLESVAGEAKTSRNEFVPNSSCAENHGGLLPETGIHFDLSRCIH
jgi:hypothetical protein